MHPTISEKNERNYAEVRRYSFYGNFTPIYFTIAMFFTGSFLIAYFGFQTIITLFEFVRIFALIVVLSFLVQRYLFNSFFPMKQMENLLVATSGIAPFVTGLILMANFYIPLHEWNATCELQRVIHKNGQVYFQVDELPCEDFPELCSTFSDDKGFRRQSLIRAKLSKGIIGYTVLRDVELLP